MFQNKLELLTGVLSSNMHLELRNTEDQFVGILGDDDSTLENSRAKTGYQLRVQDLSVKTVGSNNGVSNGDSSLDDVPKFDITEEEYDKRAGGEKRRFF